MTICKSTSQPSDRAPRAAVGRIGAYGALLLAALLALTLTLAPRAEAYVYWASGGSIERANLDGTGVNQGFITGLPGAYGGLAVDRTHVYWSITAGEVFGGPDEIGRANLDGTGVDNRFITDVSEPWAMAVDAEHVYWTNIYYDWAGGSPSPTGTIGRANLDGSGVEPSFITGLGELSGVAVDDAHIYWTEESNTIGRANLDGSGVDQSFITGPRSSLMSAPEVHDEHIYWAEAFLESELPRPTIGRANLDGTGVDNTFIASEGPGPTGVNGVAVGAGHIYWTTQYMGIGPPPAPPPFSDVISRANLDGTGVEQCFIDAWGKDVEVDELGPGNSAPPGCELPPTNEFSFGQVKKNKKKGRAKLTVSVPGPGELDLAKTKKVKADDESVEEAGKEKLAIKPRGKAKKELNRKGKAKVAAEVTYTPEGGEPNTQSKRVRLIKRR